VNNSDAQHRSQLLAMTHNGLFQRSPKDLAHLHFWKGLKARAGRAEGIS
jgi:hypothetical protein